MVAKFVLIALVMAFCWTLLQLFRLRCGEVDKVRAEAARHALQALLAKQREDLNSFNIRTSLQLSNLDHARQTAAGEPRLEATLNMVKSFLGSTNLFRSKWANQVARLKSRFPHLVENPEDSGLAELERLPDGLAQPERLIREALASA